MLSVDLEELINLINSQYHTGAMTKECAICLLEHIGVTADHLCDT